MRECRDQTNGNYESTLRGAKELRSNGISFSAWPSIVKREHDGSSISIQESQSIYL